MMEKPAQIYGQDGAIYEILATEGLLTFCRRLAEMEAGAGLTATFDDTVIHQMAEVLEKRHNGYHGGACADSYNLQCRSHI